jgi:membrane protease YdiL (CAAX protease family)
MATNIENPAPAGTAPGAPTLRATLRELAVFLKRPRVLEPWGLFRREAWGPLAILMLVHVGGLMLVILPLIMLWQSRFMLPMPDAFGKLPGGWLLPITMAIAPLLEEIIFRGWQTGRPRALWLLVCFAAFVGLVPMAKLLAPLVLAGLLLALVIAAVAGWLWLRRREAPRVYRRAYPVVFWVTALLFAAVHLMNYPATSAMSLPMVLPQFWAAAMLGFTRQRLGLPAAILQHAAANAASMALAIMGG